MTTYQCNNCHDFKNKSEFHKNKLRKTGFHSICKKCKAHLDKEYNSTEGRIKIKKEQDRERHEQLRMTAFSIYSNEKMICANCKCDDINVLAIDHINNDGCKARKNKHSGGYFYYWLKKNRYPNGFQVLCRNCNWLKHLYYQDKKGV